MYGGRRYWYGVEDVFSKGSRWMWYGGGSGVWSLSTTGAADLAVTAAAAAAKEVCREVFRIWLGVWWSLPRLVG